MTSASEQRRARRAADLADAIVEAARSLFAEQGYFATTIEQVARRADVSPATVYAVAGGKQGLIGALVQQWADAPILHDSAQRLTVLEEPVEVLHLVASASRRVREQYGDIMRVLLSTAAHDSAVAAGLSTSTTRYRGHLHAAAQRLEDLGGLGDGGRSPARTVAEATDVLWFYFGYSGYFTLIDDNGWTIDRAEQWLFTQAASALGLR